MELCFVIVETVIVIITLVIVIFLEKLHKEKEEFLENMLEIEKEYSGKLEEEIEFLRERNQQLAEEIIKSVYYDEEVEDVREVKGKH